MDDILALYEWALGDCFRCAATGVSTIHIREIATPVGVLYEVRACEGCVLELEEDRRLRAEAISHDYEPGGLSA